MFRVAIRAKSRFGVQREKPYNIIFEELPMSDVITSLYIPTSGVVARIEI